MTRLKAIKQSLHCDHKNEIWRKNSICHCFVFWSQCYYRPPTDTWNKSHFVLKRMNDCTETETMFWKLCHIDDAVDLKNWVLFQKHFLVTLQMLLTQKSNHFIADKINSCTESGNAAVPFEYFCKTFFFHIMVF